MSRIQKAHDELVDAIRQETGFSPIIEIKLVPPDKTPGGL